MRDDKSKSKGSTLKDIPRASALRAPSVRGRPEVQRPLSTPATYIGSTPASTSVPWTPSRCNSLAGFGGCAVAPLSSVERRALMSLGPSPCLLAPRLSHPPFPSAVPCPLREL